MADIRSNININVDTSNALASIKQLQAQISAFHTSIRNSGNAANQAISNQLTGNLVNSINATKQFSASLSTVNSRAQSFTNALEKNKLSLGQYFKYGAASTKTFGKTFRKEFDTIEATARDRVATMQTQFITLGKNAQGSFDSIKVKPLSLDMQNLGTQVAMTAQKQQIFNQLLNQGSTNLLNFGKNTQWAGRQLMVGLTIPLSLLGSMAMKTFSDLEEQAIRFKRVYGELFTTEAETNAMIKELDTLARSFTKYGVAVADTMGLAADAAAMGKMGADLTAQVAEATRLAVLGGVEQGEALETTISITNAFGTAAEELAGKIDFLNAVENQTVTSIEDLTIAIPKAGPVIKELGGDVEDLAFFLTAMKEGGINASEGANALKSGLARMINPTKVATEMLGNLGINIKEIVEGNSGDIKSTVLDLASALDELDPLNKSRAIEQLFGRFQFARISTLFNNVVSEGNQAQRVLQLTAATSEELAILSERELKRVEDSPLFRFQKAVEDIQKALVPLGKQFMELITPLINFATGLLEQFNGLDSGVKKFVTGAVAALGLIAPVALMTFGLFANGVANLIKGFGAIRGLFLKLTYAGTGLNSQLQYMTQEHLEAYTAANTLGTAHSNLANIFTVESTALKNLVATYQQATSAMNQYNVAAQTRVRGGGGGAQGGLKLASGIESVPGPRGAGDIVPAMLSPGEAVIPARQAQKYSSFISSIISDQVPGMMFGGIVGRMMTRFKKPNFSEMSKMRKDPRVIQQWMRGRRNKVGVRMSSDNLFEMLASGDSRYTNLFDTGTSAVGDTPSQRAMVERQLFGIDPSAPGSQRPVYGYMFNQERRVGLRHSKNRISNFLTRFGFGKRRAARQSFDYGTGNLLNDETFRYGNLTLVPNKKAIKNRTTLTYGDSYNARNEQFATPLPWTQAGKATQQQVKGAYTSKDKFFVEAQIMGGFDLKDVDRIITTQPRLRPVIEDRLRKAGYNIPVGLPKYSFMDQIKRIFYPNRASENQLPTMDRRGIYKDRSYQPGYGRKSGTGSDIITQPGLEGNLFQRLFGAIKGYENGVFSVPGPKGAGDIVPAMLAPGEAVVPAKQTQKYAGLIKGIISDNIPGFQRSNVKVSGSTVKLGDSAFETKTDKQALLLQNTLDKLIEAAKLLGLSAEDAEQAVIALAKQAKAESADKNISSESVLKQEEQEFGGGLQLAGNRTVGVRKNLEKDRLIMGNEGVTLSHAGSPVPLTEKERLAISQQMGPGAKKQRLEDFSKPMSAYSEEVYPTPAILNAENAGGILTKGQAADIIRQDPSALASDAADAANIDPNSPAFKQFGLTVADKLAENATEAFQAKDLTPAVRESIDEMPDSQEKRVLQERQRTFKTLGGDGDKRFGVPKNVKANIGENFNFVGGPGYLQRRDSKTPAQKMDMHLGADQQVLQISRDRVKAAEAQAAKNGRSVANIFVKSRNTILKASQDSFVLTRKRKSPHHLAAKDGKDDAVAYNRASQKEHAKQQKILERQHKAQRRAQIGGRAFGALGTASMIAGMGSMMGGPVGSIAGAAMGPLMGVSALAGVLPMLMNPIGAAVGALGALGAAAYFLKKNFDDQVEESRKLNEALGTSTAAIENLAKAAGNVTATQTLDRRRENAFSPYQIQSGKTPFGEMFLDTDAGKVMVESLQKAADTMGPDGIQTKLIQQLATGVASGALSAEQARSIGFAFADQLGSSAMGLNIAAELNSLVGPNGENLLDKPLEVRVNLIEDSRSSLENLFSQRPVVSPTAAQFNDNDYLNLPNDSSPDKYIGDKYGITELLKDTPDASEIATPTQIGEMLAVTTSLVDQQKQLTDSLQLDYEKRIQIAKEAGDMEEAARLQDEYISNRNELMAENAKTMSTITSSIMGLDNANAVLDKFKSQITTKFEDNPILSEALPALFDKINSLETDQQIIINAELLSGNLDPLTLNNLLNDEDGEKLVNIITKIGGVEGDRASEIAGFFGDSTVEVRDTSKPLSMRETEEVSRGSLFLKQLNTLPASEILEVLDGYSRVLQTSAAIGEDGVADLFAFYQDNPDALSTMTGDIKAIEKAASDLGDEDLTIEMITKHISEGTQGSIIDELRANQEYFDGLPDNQKVVYTTVLRTIFETGGSLQDQAIAAAVRENEELFDGMNYNEIASNIGPSVAAAEALSWFRNVYLPETVTAMGPDGESKKTTDPDPGNTGATVTDPIDAILERLKRVRDLAINAKGGLDEMFRALKDGFSLIGTDQKLLFSGYSSQFVNAVMSMDEDTRKRFVNIKNGVLTVTAAGKALAKAYSQISLGEFNLSLTQGLSDTNKQIQAMNILQSRGMSSADAFDIVKDATLAYAIATSATTEDVDALIASTERLTQAQKELETSTISGKESAINSALADIKDFFSAQEEAVRLTFGESSNFLTNVTDGILILAQLDIQNLQGVLDDLNYDLDQVKEREDEINERYDKRVDALEQVYEVNQNILDQEKDQLNVASAIASGDIAAAAKAIQETRANEAQRQRERAQEVLENARQREINAVTAENGKTRLEIEDEIKKTTKEIVEIEEKRLEPAQKTLRELERQRDVALEAIGTDGYLGKTKEEWSAVENGIRLAKVESQAYADSIKEALDLIPGLKEAYSNEGVVPEDEAGSNLTADQQAAIDTIKSNRSAVRTSEGTTSSDKELMKENIRLIKMLDEQGVDRSLFMAKGGTVPKYYAAGGFARGTDVVPAMLTPGEFVVSKYGVDKFGADRLKAINSGTFSGGNMYNSYAINVNVKSDANPDQIARSVMTQIKGIESQRMRSNRY